MFTEYSIAVEITEQHRLELDRDQLARSVKALQPGKYTLRLKRGAKRSLDQNAYWWAVPVKILAEHCGYTDTQMHYALLGECFGFVEGPAGHPVPVKPSSSELTVDEFKHLVDWVLTWAPTELGVVLPEPGEVIA